MEQNLENAFLTQKILSALPFCVVAFCVSFLVVLLLFLFVKKRTMFANSLDKTHLYKIPRFYPTPKIGGLGVILGVGVVFVGAGLYEHFAFYMFGGIIVFLSGFFRDIGLFLSAKIGVVLQALGVFLSLVGLDIWLKYLGLGFELPYSWGILFSICVILGVCDCVNVIDKFNGLSGGFVLCVCISAMSVAISVDMDSVVVISATLGSATLGFLILNFPNGKIFLGSGGAYFLGFCIAMILVVLTQTNYSIVSPWYALCMVMYPVWEVLFLFFKNRVFSTNGLIGIKSEKNQSYHFHTLLFNRLGNNPLTSFIILCLQIPFMGLATLFYANTFALMMTCVAFVVLYSVMYHKLSSSNVRI